MRQLIGCPFEYLEVPTFVGPYLLEYSYNKKISSLRRTIYARERIFLGYENCYNIGDLLEHIEATYFAFAFIGNCGMNERPSCCLVNNFIFFKF